MLRMSLRVSTRVCIDIDEWQINMKWNERARSANKSIIYLTPFNSLPLFVSASANKFIPDYDDGEDNNNNNDHTIERRRKREGTNGKKKKPRKKLYRIHWAWEEMCFIAINALLHIYVYISNMYAYSGGEEVLGDWQDWQRTRELKWQEMPRICGENLDISLARGSSCTHFFFCTRILESRATIRIVRALNWTNWKSKMKEKTTFTWESHF